MASTSTFTEWTISLKLAEDLKFDQKNSLGMGLDMGKNLIVFTDTCNGLNMILFKSPVKQRESIRC